MSTLVALNELAMSRPTVHAPARVVADWYEDKAAVMHQIAGTCSSVSERDRFESFARQAREHAVRLLGGRQGAGRPAGRAGIAGGGEA
jgi:hypothetical protein